MPPEWACPPALLGPIKPSRVRRAFALAGGGSGRDERRAAAEDRRRGRLAASLRENLKRRKAQSRARSAEAAQSDGPAERTPGDPGR
jgi:hypothetical protein